MMDENTIPNIVNATGSVVVCIASKLKAKPEGTTMKQVWIPCRFPRTIVNAPFRVIREASADEYFNQPGINCNRSECRCKHFYEVRTD